MADPRALTPLEARIVGVLVEKQATVADSYPLSLNALAAGCNQKTARDPVMAVTDAELLEALDALKSLHLAIEVGGSRVTRYEHNFKRVLALPGQSVALLATLMLRGPQTAAELRAASERLHRFADISSVEGFLDELAAREPPLVVKMARQPGAREQRWAHLLCGPPAAQPASAHADAAAPSADALSALRADHERLAAEVEGLRRQLRALADAAGFAIDG